MELPNFLKKKYDLHNSKEVKSASQRTEKKTGEKVAQNPESQITNYLARFKEILDRKDTGDREMGIQALKKVLLDKFVTKYEDIPESWHALNERILREQGHGATLNQQSKEQMEEARHANAEAVLADQEASLEQWIDYMFSPDSSYMPDYIKYWTFRSITDLAEFDKEKGEFPKRSKGTVKMFPDINQEALSYVIDAVIKKHTGQQFDFANFTADLTPEQQNKFTTALDAENFAKLYSWANEQIHPIAKHLLPVTKGIWVKYDQDRNGTENYKQLNQQIRGRGTGWCTAGENTAKSQLEQGDFYVYYTEDDEGDPLIPRIAIRMQENKIAEVRGIAYKQNLDPYMGEVLSEKLEEFPDKKEYLKKDSDMKTLTAIENKTKKGEELTKEELVFIYEINEKIQGFGYTDDPRVKELRDGRNKEADMPIVFDCTPEQIAKSPNEVNENTKVYVGTLFDGIFQKNIEHIFTSFPEGTIQKYKIEIGGKTKKQYERELKDKNISLWNNAKFILKSNEWEPMKLAEEASLVLLSVEALGFPSGATTDQIYSKAESLGLELCPPETGPEFRLSYNGKDYVVIGMKPISDSDGYPSVFDLDTDGDGLVLYTPYAGPAREWFADNEFVFRIRKLKA